MGEVECPLARRHRLCLEVGMKGQGVETQAKQGGALTHGGLNYRGTMLGASKKEGHLRKVPKRSQSSIHSFIIHSFIHSTNISPPRTCLLPRFRKICNWLLCVCVCFPQTRSILMLGLSLFLPVQICVQNQPILHLCTIPEGWGVGVMVI